MNKHSFSVKVAEQYGIEKAILLDNFFFWCQQNAANGKNIHQGRAYTYNTAEAFAQLFPYMKARKIAELLRQMETDGLLQSLQNQGTNRVKSYTLTDKAQAFYTSVAEAAAQKLDVPTYGNLYDGTYKNTTMEHTEIRYCSITDNKLTDSKLHIQGAGSGEPTPTPAPEKPRAKTKEEKHKHGSEGNVLLTDTELGKLKDKHGEEKTQEAIEYLSMYKAEKGYKSKSDYLTLLRWVFKAIEEKAERRGARPAKMQNDVYTGDGSDW
jgi:hypothetical protein